MFKDLQNTELLLEYAEAHTTSELPVLQNLNRETHLTQVYPRMLAGQMQGTFLRFISGMMKPERILEIGTFTGYSALNLAFGLSDGGILHTIEVDPEQEEIINRYIHEAGFENRITLHIGPALEIIPTLNLTWDLVYIDADKPNYLNYYNLVFQQVRPGGFILADNALWDGKVIYDRKKMNRDTRGIDTFNTFIQNDDRVENMILPFRDGIMIVRKK
ncbi:MAG: O-methyltransferase [Bacteroidales bacterium]|jgi:predicted O-methyltransferase YrrM|nr:O-methyltransferase [Bacteroidales bacterium]